MRDLKIERISVTLVFVVQKLNYTKRRWSSVPEMTANYRYNNYYNNLEINTTASLYGNRGKCAYYKMLRSCCILRGFRSA